MDIKYTVVDDFDHVFDEKGNSFLSLRKLYWGNNPDNVKLDIRRWYTSSDGTETVGKGISFITEEGPNNLARVLLQNGFGHTKEVLESIKDREDFRSSLNSILDKNDEHYDPSIEDDMYVPGDNMFDYEE